MGGSEAGDGLAKVIGTAQRFQPNPAFTMMERLVAMAIIAILANCLLPAPALAQRTRVACLA